jgi:hypothetical protein
MIGNWNGLYWYDSSAETGPTEFAAEFRSELQDYAFSGTITDSVPLMEAGVKGTIDGATVEFVKQYTRPGCLGIPRASIRYTGTISDDGNRIQGDWELKQFLITIRGSWQAERA